MAQQHTNQMQQQNLNQSYIQQGYTGQNINHSQIASGQQEKAQVMQNTAHINQQNGVNQALSHLSSINDTLNDANQARRRDSINHQLSSNQQINTQTMNHMPQTGLNQSAIQTLSQGGDSLSPSDLSLPEHIAMNLPRRRDSGNWSGDRNSASSASSTTATECGNNPAAMLNFHGLHGNGNNGGKRMNQLGLDQG